MAEKKKKPQVRESVALYDAKTNLSALVDAAAAGAEFIITKSGKPRARLVPLDDVRPLRVPGRGRGKWHLGPDFDAPLPAAVLEGFGGPK